MPVNGLRLRRIAQNFGRAASNGITVMIYKSSPVAQRVPLDNPYKTVAATSNLSCVTIPLCPVIILHSVEFVLQKLNGRRKLARNFGNLYYSKISCFVLAFDKL